MRKIDSCQVSHSTKFGVYVSRQLLWKAKATYELPSIFCCFKFYSTTLQQRNKFWCAANLPNFLAKCSEKEIMGKFFDVNINQLHNWFICVCHENEPTLHKSTQTKLENFNHIKRCKILNEEENECTIYCYYLILSLHLVRSNVLWLHVLKYFYSTIEAINIKPPKALIISFWAIDFRSKN